MNVLATRELRHEHNKQLFTILAKKKLDRISETCQSLDSTTLPAEMVGGSACFMK